jgi:hypothetical protein
MRGHNPENPERSNHSTHSQNTGMRRKNLNVGRENLKEWRKRNRTEGRMIKS